MTEAFLEPLIAGRVVDETPPLSKLGAKVHQVPVCWRVRTSENLVVGPEPKMVLAVYARRDVELLLVRVDFPEQLLKAEGVGESVLAQVPHVVGLRKLRPTGEPWVWGQEGVNAAPMFSSDRPEERAAAPSQVRWYGDVVQLIELNACHAPNDYWCWRGRVAIPKGLSVGIIVRADRPTVCRARMSGV